MRDAKRQSGLVLLLAILLVVPSVAVLAPSATADPLYPQDGSPATVIPNVHLQYHEVPLKSFLYFHQPSAKQSSQTQAAPKHTFAMEPNGSILDNQDPYLVQEPTGTGATVTNGTIATYTTAPLAANLTIQGGNSLGSQVAVHAPPLLDWHVSFSVVNPRTHNVVAPNFASKVWQDQRQPNPQTNKYAPSFGLNFTVPFESGRSSIVVPKGDEIQVSIFATPGASAQTPTGTSACTSIITSSNLNECVQSGGGWALYYDSSSWKADSGVFIYSPDAMQVAIWGQDGNGQPITYLPDHADTSQDVVTPYLAIRSAWGANLDQLAKVVPTFQMTLDDAAYSYSLTDQSGTTGPKVAVQDLVASPGPNAATEIYTLPNQKVWNYGKGYDNAPHGTFDLLATASVHGRPVASDLGWRLIHAQQSIGLAMFKDDTASHPVQPGSSTTYLVNVTNGGTVNDTFTLSLGSNALVNGWTGTIAGPTVRNGNQIHLGPGQSGLLRVTITAPSSASLGSSSLFQLKATSKVDSGSQQQLGLVASVSNVVTHGVSLLAGAGGTHVDVRPNGTATLDVLVWNRGTVPTTLTTALDHVNSTGWDASLLVGGQSGNEFNLPNVPPGDIAHVTVQFRARNPSVTTYAATVNATYAGNPEAVPTLPLTATIHKVSGLQINVLSGFGGQRMRYMEMWCSASGPGCPDENGYPSSQPSNALGEANDSVNVTWFRAWITNTGDEPGPTTYHLNLTSGGEQPLFTYGDQPGAFTKNWNGANPQIFRKTANGFVSLAADGAAGKLVLKPGQTGEVYIKLRHHVDTAYANQQNSGRGYLPSNYTFTLQVSGGGSSQSATMHVQGAQNLHGFSQVGLQAVSRLPGYFDLNKDFYSPLVNVKDATNTTVQHAVVVGAGHPDANTTYCVRVTDGNTFQTVPRNDNASVTVKLSGIDRNTGWRAAMRNGCGDSQSKWGDSLVIKPGAQGWTGHEVEVRVFAPNITKTQKPLAGQFSSLTLTATGGWAGAGSSATLNLVTRIAPVPLLTMSSESTSGYVQQGKTTAFVVNLVNNGSATGVFDLRSKVDQQGWTVTPSDANITLDPYQKQTLALLVTAPNNAPAGSQANVALNATWLDLRTQGKPVDEQRHLTAGPLNLQATVVSQGNLRINASTNATTLHPGGSTQIPFQVLYTGNSNQGKDVKLSFFGPSNWTAALSSGVNTPLHLLPNKAQTSSIVLQAPSDVVQGSSFAFVVKAVDTGDSTNFALYSFTVTISQGSALPVIHVSKANALVDRNGSVRFRLQVANRGTAPDTFPLIVDQPQRSGWSARLETADGTPVTSIQLNPNTQKDLYLNVSAPQKVAPGSRIPVSVEAYASDYAPGSKAKATLTAVIHDYKVGLSLAKDHVNYIAGTPFRVHMNLTNLGNGNDTLNVSMALQGLQKIWSVQFSRSTVRLHPGQSQDIVATLRSPLDPLPTPRILTFEAWAGSMGAADHHVWTNTSTPLVVNVLDYRSADVDGDGHPELAVNLNQNAADGFEHFQEIYRDGANTTVVLAKDLTGDGKVDFLLDNPAVHGLDGIADVFWDPSHAVVTKIQYTPDISGDGSPDYLIDSTGDGAVNLYVNAVTKTVGTATAVHITGDKGAKQVLVDTNHDGTPDAYFDPAKDLVTRVHTNTGQGANVVGIDTTGDGHVNKYFNTQSQQVFDAQGANLAQFAGQYWYLFILLVVVLAAFGVVVRRRRMGGR